MYEITIFHDKFELLETIVFYVNRKENSIRREVYTKFIDHEAGNYKAMAMRIGYKPKIP